MNIGLIGLGTMGGRMGDRLLSAGHTLVVYDRVPALVDRLAGAGATAATSVADVVGHAEVILTSLPMPADVEAVLTGPDGVLSHLRDGQVVVDLSTIDPDTARRMEAALTRRGAAFLDGPVSGGPTGAAAGTLTVMVGGDAASLEKARPALEAFSGKIIHVGPAGAGSTIKLANQLLVAANTIASLEAIRFVERAGIAPEQALEVLSASAGDSVMLRRSVRDFLLTGDYSPAFALRLLLKDLRLYAAEAGRLETPTPAGAVSLTLYEDAARAGLQDLDYVAIVKLLDGEATPSGE